MRNQTNYLFIYLCVVCLLVASVTQKVKAQEQTTLETSEVIELDQAQLDQILAPIALYPDTLLSHILVASTYPLEVIQAARWRGENEDLNEQQALNAVEDKDWDPSVQALVPFNDLLQKLSEDLDWLQSLGSAFLMNEQQILSSVQNLRQKAYEQGNLTDNDYVNVEQDDGEIVIETVRKEVVYVPYYDTRVVYGNWWWHNHQPYYWHRPIHSIFSAGLHWSVGFNIRPSFYFGGFHWRNRHVVANYHYRRNANRHWSNRHNNRQVVRVNEYPRWSHNQQHRRGAQHRVNGQRIVRNLNNGNSKKGYQQINKQRVLNTNNYSRQHNKKNTNRIKQALSNKQLSSKQKNKKSQQYASLTTQNNKAKRVTIKTNNKTRTYNSKNKSSDKNKTSTYKSKNQRSYKRNYKDSSSRTASNKQNKSRSVKIARQSHSKGKQK